MLASKMVQMPAWGQVREGKRGGEGRTREEKMGRALEARSHGRDEIRYLGQGGPILDVIQKEAEKKWSVRVRTEVRRHQQQPAHLGGVETCALKQGRPVLS